MRYAEIREAANQEVSLKTPLARLELLFRGLLELRFAGRPLHPEIQNLEALIYKARLGVASDATVACWIERLYRELDEGERRARFGTLFGGLLEAWAEPRDAEQEPPHPAESCENSDCDGANPSGRELAREAFFKMALSEEEETPEFELFDALVAAHAGAENVVVKGTQAYAEGDSWQQISRDEVRGNLLQLARSPYRNPKLCAVARSTALDEIQVNECVGALTILLHGLERWQWPEGGVEVELLWARDRWRPFLADGLLNQLLLSVIGMRWGIVLKQLFAQRGSGFCSCRVYPPDEMPWPNSVESLRLQKQAELFMLSVPDSMCEFKTKARNQSTTEHYDGHNFADEEPDAMQKVLMLLGGEIGLLRAVDPQKPIVVLRTDIKLFFPSFSHALARKILEAQGFPERWIALMLRMLAVRVRRQGSVYEVLRGIPLDSTLSYLLAESFLRLLERYVFEVSGLQLIRFMDDLVLVTSEAKAAVKAWEAIQAFCADAGFALNAKKTGAVVIGGDKPEELPRGGLRWAFLELQPCGDWGVNESALKRFEERLQKRLERPGQAILSKVFIYNSYMRYLVRGMAPFARLGAAHFDAISHAVARVHMEGEGLSARLRALLLERFEKWADALPDAWLYWPLTAGGLGLCDPVMLMATFYCQRCSLTLPDAPMERGEDWEKKDQAWWAHYSALCSGVGPKAPIRTARIRSLLASFIERGSEISGTEQIEIGVYWEWIVQIYGDEILKHLGDFSFLIPELVPAQLIAQSRIITASVDKGMQEFAGLGGESLQNAVEFLSSHRVAAEDDGIPF